MLSDRFVVEAGRRTVGIAVKVKGGYRFFASEPLFFPLEGMVFSDAKSMSERVAEIAQSEGFNADSHSTCLEPGHG